VRYDRNRSKLLGSRLVSMKFDALPLGHWAIGIDPLGHLRLLNPIGQIWSAGHRRSSPIWCRWRPAARALRGALRGALRRCTWQTPRWFTWKTYETQNETQNENACEKHVMLNMWKLQELELPWIAILHLKHQVDPVRSNERREQKLRLWCVQCTATFLCSNLTTHTWIYY
jgi:hypothetical protein